MGKRHKNSQYPTSMGRSPVCSHRGEKIIYQFVENGKTLAMRGSTIYELHNIPTALYVDLEARPKPIHQTETAFPPGFEPLESFLIHSAPILQLYCEDGSIPYVKPEFWQELVRLAFINNKTDLVFSCVGSHGRTGYAMASTLIAVAHMDPDTAINYVRDRHCHEAIETQIQINGLERLGQHFGFRDRVMATPYERMGYTQNLPYWGDHS